MDNSFVKQDKQAFFDHGNRISGLTLEQIKFTRESDSKVTVTLTKDVTWDSNSGPVHKLIDSSLVLTKFDNGWKITSETDLKSVPIVRRSTVQPTGPL